VIHVSVHFSQYPERVRSDLMRCLQTRTISHKFHYDSYKQAQKWLALHEAYSPARNDPGCLEIYTQAFAHAANLFHKASVHVIGLGCGGGHKDAALLEHLSLWRSRGTKEKRTSSVYTAVDVSMPLVVAAQQRAAQFTTATHGLICDLEIAHDLGEALRETGAGGAVGTPCPTIFTFFGMIPNSEPDVILARLRELLSRGDVLLLNANLAPGSDYRSGVERVLPQYDNKLSADWLLTLLYDLGVQREEGELKFTVEKCPSELLRIRADFTFTAPRAISLDAQVFKFVPGDKVRLFYSYRYTPALLEKTLAAHDFALGERWIAPSGEEGVFIVQPR
jgi:uncharacterized SAM-dependent methyltransferase